MPDLNLCNVRNSNVLLIGTLYLAARRSILEYFLYSTVILNEDIFVCFTHVIWQDCFKESILNIGEDTDD